MLTPKQQLFVAEYVKDLNATQAAIRAGYTKHRANQAGHELLTNPDIEAEVKRLTAEQLAVAGLEAIDVKRMIGWQIRRDIRKLFDDQGNLKPIHQLTEEEASYIDGLDVVKRNLTAGDGTVDTVLKLKLANRAQYVEMGAKHHGLLVERVEHGGALVIRHEAL